MNDIGEIRLRTSKPLVFDAYATNRLTGSLFSSSRARMRQSAPACFFLPPRWRGRNTRISRSRLLSISGPMLANLPGSRTVSAMSFDPKQPYNELPLLPRVRTGDQASLEAVSRPIEPWLSSKAPAT